MQLERARQERERIRRVVQEARRRSSRFPDITAPAPVKTWPEEGMRKVTTPKANDVDDEGVETETGPRRVRNAGAEIRRAKAISEARRLLRDIDDYLDDGRLYSARRAAEKIEAIENELPEFLRQDVQSARERIERSSESRGE